MTTKHTHLITAARGIPARTLPAEALQNDDGSPKLYPPGSRRGGQPVRANIHMRPGASKRITEAAAIALVAHVEAQNIGDQYTIAPIVVRDVAAARRKAAQAESAQLEAAREAESSRKAAAKKAARAAKKADAAAAAAAEAPAAAPRTRAEA